MSYILDALKRANADRERERGAVPGLHAHTTAALDAPSTLGTPVQMLIWVAAALCAVGLGALAVYFSRPSAPAPTPAATAVAPTPAPAPPVAAPTPAPAPAPVAAPAAAPAAPVSAAAMAAASAALRLSPPPVKAASAPVTAPAPLAQTAAASSAKTDRIYTLNELPEEVRAQLPAVAISGASYSSNAAQRLLIVNGNVVQERGNITPELVLEQIGETSAVLRFREYRYRVGY
jgi:general secretion pathway protein B